MASTLCEGSYVRDGHCSAVSDGDRLNFQQPFRLAAGKPVPCRLAHVERRLLPDLQPALHGRRRGLSHGRPCYHARPDFRSAATRRAIHRLSLLPFAREHARRTLEPASSGGRPTAWLPPRSARTAQLTRTGRPLDQSLSLPLFYKDPVLLRFEEHADVGLAPASDYSFAREAVWPCSARRWHCSFATG